MFYKWEHLVPKIQICHISYPVGFSKQSLNKQDEEIQ